MPAPDATRASKLARCCNRSADGSGGNSHSLVVGDDAGEVVAELLRGGEMDRVERAKLGRQQRTGGGEDPVADPDQLQPREHLPAAPDSWLTKRKQRSGHLGPRERARDERPPPTQVAA